MSDVIIIGKGPAGISAALYTRRAGLSTRIIGQSGGALEKTDRIENYYGFPEPISGRELLERGVANALRLGCELTDDEVVSVTFDGGYTVKTRTGEHRAGAVILATGAARNAPPLPGISEFEGRGVSYCAVCDAFFYRKKDVAVLGGGDYALHEARELLPVVGSVTLLTNGAEPPAALPEGLRADSRILSAIEGDTAVRSIRFTAGEPIAVSGVFIAVGIASSADLAKKLGAETDGNRIAVNAKMETNLPGLFAAGDCTGGLLQIAKAVSDGAIAGTGAVRFLRGQKKSG